MTESVTYDHLQFVALFKMLLILLKKTVFSISFLWTLKTLQVCVTDSSNHHMYNHINNLFSSERIIGYKFTYPLFLYLVKLAFDSSDYMIIESDVWFPLLFHLFIVCIAANALNPNVELNSDCQMRRASLLAADDILTLSLSCVDFSFVCSSFSKTCFSLQIR